MKQRTAFSQQAAGLRCFAALLLVLLLSGCGTYYNVSVDSLRDDQLAARAEIYYLKPGNAGVAQDDLLFREVCRILIPAFTANGFQIEDGNAATQNVAVISYGTEKPSTTLEVGTTMRSVPVVLRDGKKDKVEYITVEEPTLTERTTYEAWVLVEAWALQPDGKQQALWRTSARCSGPTGDLRSMIGHMMPVLAGTLGSRTEGTVHYEVFVDENGQTSATRIY